MGLLTAAYLYFQFTRTNVTIDITSRATAEWLTYLSWPAIAEFVLVTVFRFTFILGVLQLSGTAASLLALVILLLLGLWFGWQWWHRAAGAGLAGAAPGLYLLGAVDPAARAYTPGGTSTRR